MTRPLVVGVAALLAAAIAMPADALEWPGRVEQTRERISDDDAETRAAAVARLTRSDPDAALQVLSQAAADSVTEVRQAAAAWIGEHRAWEAESIAVALLSDRRPAVRVAAATALGRLGTYGVLDPLVRALTDTSPEVRLAAIDALAALGRPESVLALIDATQDGSRDVAIAAVEALGDLGDPGAVFALLEKLHDPVSSVAIAAAGALGQLRADEAVPGLIELAQTGRADEVVAAIGALGRIGSREAIPVLLAEAMNPRFAEAGPAAVDALRLLPDPRVTAAMLPHVATQPVALALVGSADSTSWPQLRAAWQGGPHASRVELLSAWLRTGDPLAVDAAHNWLAASDALPEERASLLLNSPTEAAFCARVALTPPASAEAWEQVLSHAVDSRAGRCLVEVVDATEPSRRPDLSELAVAAQRAGAPGLTAALDRWIDVDRVDVAAAAVVSATALDEGEAGASLLLRLLASRVPSVRREAAWALADLRGEALEPEAVSQIIERSDVEPELAGALLGFLHGPHASMVREAARRWLASGSAQLRVEGWTAAAEDCSVLDHDAVADALDEPDLWVRVASARALLACGRHEELRAMTGLPGVGALVARAAPVTPELARHPVGATEDDVRVAWMAGALDAGAADELPLDELTRDRSVAVRSAAQLLQARLDEGPAPASLALQAAATDSPLEQQVLAAIVRRHDDPDALARIVRASAEPETARVALAPGPAFTSPVQVVLVDGQADAPLSWHPVFVVWDDLSFALERTDASGRLRIVRPGVVIAWPLGLEP